MVKTRKQRENGSIYNHLSSHKSKIKNRGNPSEIAFHVFLLVPLKTPSRAIQREGACMHTHNNLIKFSKEVPQPLIVDE